MMQSLINKIASFFSCYNLDIFALLCLIWIVVAVIQAFCYLFSWSEQEDVQERQMKKKNFFNETLEEVINYIQVELKNYKDSNFAFSLSDGQIDNFENFLNRKGYTKEQIDIICSLTIDFTASLYDKLEKLHKQ